MSNLSAYAVVLFIAGTLLYGAAKRVDCFDTFAQGAQMGLRTCLHILPTLVGMLMAISLLRASGLLDVLIRLLQPFAAWIGLPAEALPVAIVRPFSGSAAMAVLAQTLTQYGADSVIGRAACILMGASETVFYTAGLYFGSVGVQKWKQTLPLCLIVWLFSMLFAAWLA